jgi:hypothetical protein
MQSPGFVDVDFWGEFDQDAVVIDRDDVSDFNAENILPLSEDAMAKIRKWLQPTKYDGDGSEYQAHLSSHLPGTGDWVFGSKIYQQWHNSEEHRILWVRGGYSATSAVREDMYRKLTLWDRHSRCR